MKRLTVILFLLHVLGLTQAAHAVDLEAGWYVKLGSVALYSPYGWGGPGRQSVAWNPVGGLGTYGPFEVTTTAEWWPQRVVSVPSTAVGVVPGTGAWLWGELEHPVDYPFAEVSLHWETNYDASKMRLELLMYKQDEGLTLLWAEDRSGLQSGYHNVLSPVQYIPLGYEAVFRVIAVPEPSTIGAFGLGLAGTSAIWRRRRR